MGTNNRITVKDHSVERETLTTRQLDAKFNSLVNSLYDDDIVEMQVAIVTVNKEGVYNHSVVSKSAGGDLVSTDIKIHGNFEETKELFVSAVSAAFPNVMDEGDTYLDIAIGHPDDMNTHLFWKDDE